NPVSVRISTPDKELLARIGEQVARILESIHGVRDVNDNWGVKAKKLYVDVHEESARRAGVSNLDVALSLLTAFSGFQMTQLREGDKLIPVVMRSQDAEHTQLGNLRNLNVVPLTGGQGVPLSQLSQVELQFQPSKIIRRNRIRTMEVGAQLYPEVTAADVVAELEPWLREQARGWPTSVHYEFGGDAEESAKSQGAIFEKLPYALIIVVFLLVAMFNSIRRALIVLMVIPLGLIGVFVGLYVTESYIGFMTILGIVSLAGIVCNNGVVLLERIKLEVELNGLTEQQAIIEAAQRRLRPIYLTAGTTVGGLIPLWLGGGPLWEPLAIAIIFGLSFSTVLTLVVIPVVYSLLFGVSFRQQPQAQLASEVSDA
ncbi:MAG: efflux RND transporter permease subunit, partial [Myxococcota bacterium]|nr:efflux RND transporter permease subunit [Myxococcota bacterium]